MSSGPRRSPVAEGCAGGDGPCCRSSPVRGCGRDGDARPCRAGKPPSSRDHQVRTMHPYMMEELARQRVLPTPRARCSLMASVSRRVTTERWAIGTPCNHACPAGENIQAWLELAQAGKYREAWETLVRDNPLPAVHGRVCYHPCESGCNRERARQRRSASTRSSGSSATWPRAKAGRSPVAAPPSGKRVLVVGAGPERAVGRLSPRPPRATRSRSTKPGPLPGGMMHFGIPAYRLPREDLMREIAPHRGDGRAASSSITRSTTCSPRSRRAASTRCSSRSARDVGKHVDIPARDAARVLDAVSLLRDVEHRRDAAPRPPRGRLRRRQHRDGRRAHRAAAGRRRGADRLPPRPRAHAGARLRGRRGARGRHQDQVADARIKEIAEADADRRDDGARRQTACRSRPGEFETLDGRRRRAGARPGDRQRLPAERAGHRVRRRRHGGRRRRHDDRSRRDLRRRRHGRRASAPSPSRSATASRRRAHIDAWLRGPHVRSRRRSIRS